MQACNFLFLKWMSLSSFISTVTQHLMHKKLTTNSKHQNWCLNCLLINPNHPSKVYLNKSFMLSFITTTLNILKMVNLYCLQGIHKHVQLFTQFTFILKSTSILCNGLWDIKSHATYQLSLLQEQ